MDSEKVKKLVCKPMDDIFREIHINDPNFDIGRMKDIAEKHIKSSMIYFYEQAEILHISEVMRAELEPKADSYTEKVFGTVLHRNKIPFRFQVWIGPYRVDYLIDDFLVFEGDGDQHANNVEYDQKRDAYLRSIGLKVLRLNWKYVFIGQDIVIKAIQDEMGKPRGEIETESVGPDSRLHTHSAWAQPETAWASR